MSLSYRPATHVEVAIKRSPVALHSHIAENITRAAIALRYQGFRQAWSELFEPRVMMAYFAQADDVAIDVAVGSHTVNVRVYEGDTVLEYVYPLSHVTDVLIEE